MLLKVWTNVEKWDARRKGSTSGNPFINESNRKRAQSSWEHMMRDMGYTWLEQHRIGTATHTRVNFADGYELHSRVFGYSIRVIKDTVWFALYRPRVSSDPGNAKWDYPYGEAWVALGNLTNDERLRKGVEVIKARQQIAADLPATNGGVPYEYTQDRRLRRRWDVMKDQYEYQADEGGNWVPTIESTKHFSALFNPSLTPHERAQIKRNLFPQMYGARTDHVHWAADISPTKQLQTQINRFMGGAPALMDPADLVGKSVTVSFDLDEVSLKNMQTVFGGGNVTTEGTTNEGKNTVLNFDVNPDALEAAAARQMEMAQLVRDWDAREPQGEEPTISFSWLLKGNGVTTEDRVYTVVGFKSNGEGGNDKWYFTGARVGRDPLTWRQVGEQPWAENLRQGEFYVVSDWTHVQAAS